jgi:hypothetical protein
MAIAVAILNGKVLSVKVFFSQDIFNWRPLFFTHNWNTAPRNQTTSF